MRAVYTDDFGPPSVLTLSESHPVPSPSAKAHELLIRVRATSLAPGDARILLGDAPTLKKIPHGWPYVPTGDVSGVVVAVSDSPRAQAFSVGDEIVASWTGAGCDGGLADYALVDARVAVKRPNGVSAVDAAAVVNSGCHALAVVEEAALKIGERVLVIGGGGGCGSLVCQIAKARGAGWVAVTSRRKEKGPGVDEVVDWSLAGWWEGWGEGYFDVVVDCAEGRSAWENERLRGVLKVKGGRWVAVVAESWEIKLEGMLDVVKLMAPPMMRVLRSRILGGTKYIMHLKQPEVADIEQLMAMVKDGTLTAVKESVGTLNIVDVMAGFEKLISKTAHGKIVFQIWDGET